MFQLHRLHKGTLTGVKGISGFGLHSFVLVRLADLRLALFWRIGEAGAGASAAYGRMQLAMSGEPALDAHASPSPQQVLAAGSRSIAAVD